MSTHAPLEDLSFASIAEDFLRALRAGNAPSIEELTTLHPNCANEIREEFSSLLLAEQLNIHSGRAKYLRKGEMPKTLGRYRLLNEIGRGGMGQVYAALDETTQREVAIKILASVGENRMIATKRFQREAKAGGLLEHSNIIPILDYVEHRDSIFLVMPRVLGRDLARIVNDYCDANAAIEPSSSSISYQQVAQIGSQVAAALAHAHAKGFVHRDIKPANILLEPNGHVWVTDFGLVKVGDVDSSLSRSGNAIGTPRYMAPEQFRGTCDGRSDIYSLGITLYELATGRKASAKHFKRESLANPLNLKLVPIHQINPNVPKGLSAIISKCCELNPVDRFQTASELQVALCRFLQKESGRNRKIAKNSESHLSKRRFFGIAVASTLIVLGIGYITMGFD